MSDRNSNSNTKLPTFLPSSASLVNSTPGDVIEIRRLYSGLHKKGSVTLGLDFCEDSGLEFSTKNSKVLFAPRKRFIRSKHNLGIPYWVSSRRVWVSSRRVACKTFLDPDEEQIFSGLLGTGTSATNEVECRCQLLSKTFLDEPDVSSGSVRSAKRKNSAFLPTFQFFKFKQYTALA